MAKGSSGTRQGSASNPKGFVSSSKSARDEKAIDTLLYRKPGNVTGSFSTESLTRGDKSSIQSLISGYHRALDREFYSFDRDSKVRNRENSEARSHLITIESYLSGGNVSAAEFRKAASRVNTILMKWTYKR